MARYRSVLFFALSYAVLWTLITLFFDPVLPYDAVEALNWAQNREWGSPKNPWLVGLVHRPLLWFPTLPVDIYWYASHFLAVSIGMVGVWCLAWQLSASRRLAWLATLSLTTSTVINIDIIPYNDNFLLVMLWPWMMLFFLFAMTRHPGWWLMFAIVAGLATMAKYSTLSFIGVIFLATLLLPALRVVWRSLLFCLACLLWLIMVAPNLWWLVQHDFAAFRWVDSQVHENINAWALLACLMVFYPVLILWGILRLTGAHFRWPTAWQSRVVLAVCLFPPTVIVPYFSFYDGERITEWLQPFLLCTPALCVACATPPTRSVRVGVIGLAGMALVVMLGYGMVNRLNIKNVGQKFSGIKPFSRELEALWVARYHSALPYVGGDDLAEWLTVYAASRPQLIRRWSNETRPNVYNAHLDRALLARQGALLLGPRGESCKTAMFDTTRLPWPDLRIEGKQTRWFQADPSRLPEAVCVGFVPPQGGYRVYSLASASMGDSRAAFLAGI